MKQLFFLLTAVVLFASCKNTWPDEDRDAFYQSCTNEARPWAGDKAKPYCDCIFEKMVKKYPQEMDALENMDSLRKDPDLIECRSEVMKAAKP